MTNRERNLLQQNARTPKQPKLQERQGKKKNSLTSILQRLGNRTVQRLMIQRRGGESYQLDDETASD